MDKYTYNLKVEKIQALVREGDYLSAAKLADSVDWTQEHNVRLLTAVADAYEKSGQLERAMDVLLTAYERAPIGKRIMYKLTELAVQAGRIDDAESFYRKYLEEASDENNRYILQYLIAEARGEDTGKKISILETYKKYEFEEKWACRLAELYRLAGRREDCVKLCDEIILWFGVGPYVDRAMELKEFYQPLTDAQREHRENREYYQARVRAVANEMAEVMEERDNPSEAETIEEVDASEVPEEDLTGGGELPVISISDEVASARLDRSEEVVLTESEPDEGELTENAPAQQEGESEEPMVESADSLWSVQDEPVVTVADSLQAEEMEKESGAEELSAEETVAQETSQRGEEEAMEEKNMEEPVVETEEAEAAESQEEMGSTKNLKDILRRTIGMTPVDEPEDPTPTKEIRLPEELKAIGGEPVVERVPAVSSDDDDDDEDYEDFDEEETAESEEPAETAPEEPLDTPFNDSTPEGNAANTLQENANVLPVLSFEETERAVWEDQTRRRSEAEPTESYEMERCIFISAASADEGVNKAVEALDQYYQAKGMEIGQIAKITAEKLNRRGLIKSLVPLEGKDLIIDQANGLNDILIKEILRVIDRLDTEKVFVLLDTAENVEALRQRVREHLITSVGTPAADDSDMIVVSPKASEEPAARREEPPVRREVTEAEPARPERTEAAPARGQRASRKVQHLSFDRMDPRQELSERDFIRYADYFAAELECVLDDSGFDALEDEIDAILEEGGRLTAGEAQEIIVDAAEHASKPTIKRLFGGRYDKDGNLILRERDFR